MFHSSEGLYFEKLADGSVRILKRSGSQEDSPVIFDHVLSASEWAYVLAMISGSDSDPDYLQQGPIPSLD